MSEHIYAGERRKTAITRNVLTAVFITSEHVTFEREDEPDKPLRIMPLTSWLRYERV